MKPANPETTDNSLMRLPDVMRYVNLGKTSIYKMVSDGEFPQPVRVTKRAVAWRKSEIDQWIANLPRAVSETSH